jgi:hypothetical protein
VWIHPRTGPRIPDPGVALQFVGGNSGQRPVWWWTGEVDSEGGVGAETGDRRRRTRTATAAASAGWRQRSEVSGGRRRRVAGECRRGAGGVRGKRACPSWQFSGGQRHDQRGNGVVAPRRRAWTSRRKPLSLCMDRSTPTDGRRGCSLQAKARAQADRRRASSRRSYAWNSIAPSGAAALPPKQGRTRADLVLGGACQVCSVRASG